MEAIHSSETSAVREATRRHIQEVVPNCICIDSPDLIHQASACRSMRADKRDKTTSLCHNAQSLQRPNSTDGTYIRLQNDDERTLRLSDADPKSAGGEDVLLRN
jgi:hypothetical protein